jgi:hypothetical protein
MRTHELIICKRSRLLEFFRTRCLWNIDEHSRIVLSFRDESLTVLSDYCQFCSVQESISLRRPWLTSTSVDFAILSASMASKAMAFEPLRAARTWSTEAGVLSSSTGMALIAALDMTNAGLVLPTGETKS